MIGWLPTMTRLDNALKTAKGADLAIGKDIRFHLCATGRSYDARFTPDVQLLYAKYEANLIAWRGSFTKDLDRVDTVSRWAEGKQIMLNQVAIDDLRRHTLDRYDATQDLRDQAAEAAFEAAIAGMPEDEKDALREVERVRRKKAAPTEREQAAESATVNLDARRHAVDGESFLLDATTSLREWLQIARIAYMVTPNGRAKVMSDEQADAWSAERVRLRLIRSAKLPATSAEDRALIAQYAEKVRAIMDDRPVFGGNRTHPGMQSIREIEVELQALVGKAISFIEAL